MEDKNTKNRLIKHPSEETRRRLSDSHKGHIPWNKGLNTHQIPWNKGLHTGKHLSKETRKKISARLMGNKHTLGHFPSEETRKKMSLALIGNKNGMGNRNLLGSHWSDKQREKLTGSNSPNWRGGTSFGSYPLNWTETLKRSVRERDNYVCKVCGEVQGEKAFAVHHINYDKKNCDPRNLITLCSSCHSKTNNNREYWGNYLSEVVKNART